MRYAIGKPGELAHEFNDAGGLPVAMVLREGAVAIPIDETERVEPGARIAPDGLTVASAKEE